MANVADGTTAHHNLLTRSHGSGEDAGGVFLFQVAEKAFGESGGDPAWTATQTIHGMETNCPSIHAGIRSSCA
jgi:hypothetical protein